MDPKYDVPALKEIFNKIIHEKMQYCSLCFHTADERRLVKPHYFKMYIEETKICTDPKNISICYICECKCKHALKVLQYVRFSCTVKHIIEKLVQRNVLEEKNIFEKRYFRQLVKSVDLNPNTYTPAKVQGEILLIRTNFELKQSEMEISDNTSVYPRADSAYGMTCRKLARKQKATAVEYRGASAAAMFVSTSNQTDINVPKHRQQSNIAFVQPCPPTNVYILTQLGPNYSGQPKIMTRDDIISQPLDSTRNFVLHAVYTTDQDNKRTVPSLSAEIIDKTIYFYDPYKNEISSQPFDCDKDLIQQKMGLDKIQNEVKQILHAYKLPTQESSSIDSSQNVILSGNTRRNVEPTDSCHNNVKPSYSCSVEAGASKVVVLEDNNTLPANNNEAQNKIVIGSKVVSCPSKNLVLTNSMGIAPEHSKKRKKPNAPILQSFLTRDPMVSEVVISDITSDIDLARETSKKTEKRETDWEDKIPMDVISFVDAVDPNADLVFARKSSYSIPENYCTMQISDPRSLAHEVEMGLITDIVDLC